ncbi:hypothetical protein PV768_16740 [Pseudarthrobacter sp. CC4]|uniref:hypothetical protein n=1 Tax=Pseudarthrobacter TaxID=1742993 RepID=UPI002AA6CBA0|nr:hypothetical protein [Pseudarthrobacter oxydans]WPU07780.1 hypothetical protein SMD14_11300 [Pseudarthrobacter oxydans]
MTSDAGPNAVASDKSTDVTLRQESNPINGQLGNQEGAKKKERPKSILALIEFAYGEEGRKLNLARRDLRELSLQPDAAQAETDAVRRLAVGDPCLAVPPSLLAAVAELGPELPVRRRILDLVLVAFASHKVFENRLERLTGVPGSPVLTAQEMNEAAKRITFDTLGLHTASDFNEGARERLRVNAVTAFGLFRVLHDHWTADQFIGDMAAWIWNAPRDRSVPRVAALLATAKNSDALSQLSRHSEVRLQESTMATEKALAQARREELRAVTAEASAKRLSAELEDAIARTAELGAEAETLKRRLSAEQSNRVVDQSHHVDDYEALRTQVIRRLTRQAELLSKGLHALRNGSANVADEFVDRAMSAIDSEIARLKDLEEGRQ